MKRLVMGLVGLAMLGLGAYLLVTGQPEEGPYRYPADARAEARDFADRISDPAARKRFLDETTGRTKIEHPSDIFLGSILSALGLGLSLASLRRREPKNPFSVKQAA